MIMRKAVAFAVIIVFILVGTFHVEGRAPLSMTSYADTSPIEIHKGAWAMTVDTAKINPYYKYGIYTSRVLAVVHPEVYIQADSQFLRSVNKKETTSNVRRGKMYRYSTYTHLTSVFDLDEVDLDSYHTITTNDFYEGYPILPFLDSRAFTLSSTLRQLDVQKKYIINQDIITQLNKAILYYLRENGGTHMYLIYCDNENTYIYSDGKFLWAETLEEAPITGNPILIFNNEFVWYPLMGRDDTDIDPLLDSIVEAVSTTAQIPVLEPFEEMLIKGLKEVTRLDDEDQFTMAVLAASRTYTYYEFKTEWLPKGEGPEDYITNDEIGEKWMHIFPDMDASRFFTTIPPFSFGGIDFAIINEITRKGNYVSPVTARLAWAALTWPENTMAALDRSYQDLDYSWCALWNLGMQSYTIDETMYTHAGTCQVHGYNIASVLDVAGIDNFILDGYMIGAATHVINYIPVNDVIFSDGELIEDLTTILYCPKGFMFLSYQEKWAFIVKNNYFGTLSPSESIEYLSFLKKQHQDDIKGLVLMDERISEISYEELIASLKEQETWNPIEIPMNILEPHSTDIEVSNLVVSPEAVDPGERVIITIDVHNRGNTLQSTPITLQINQVPEARVYAVLDSGEKETIVFAVIKEKRQTYHIDIEGLESEFRVKGFGILVLVGCAFIIAAYFLNRYMKKWRLLRIAVKKIAAGLITLFLVMTMLFVLLHAVPGGDPVDRLLPFSDQVFKDRIRAYWGYDKPILYQYAVYMKKVFTFNFEILPGWANASDVIMYVLPITILLFGTATLISYGLGTLLGIFLLSGKESKWRSSVVYGFLVFYVFPSFVLAIFFKSWFVFKFYVFPPVSISIAKGGDLWSIYGNVYTLMTTADYTDIVKTLLPEMALPLIVLVLVGIARPLLLMRDHMALTLGEPHVVTARAKGLSQRTIRFNHVARCALLPLINDASINLVYIFGGGILIEYVFKWPGVGYILFEALKMLNVPLISAAIFMLACILVVSMVVADVVSAYLDPRIGVVQ
ncbi:MAG: ABC transporter permease [Theionarchaea archaeon]|nr:ABC transporter permease [Theionarchaea archaeon]